MSQEIHLIETGASSSFVVCESASHTRSTTQAAIDSAPSIIHAPLETASSGVDTDALVRQDRYGRLFDALRELNISDEDEAQHIDDEAYRLATSALCFLSYHGVPAPKIFSHGGDAVVFNWRQNEVTLQLTICDGVASLGKRVVGQKAIAIGHLDMFEDGLLSWLSQFGSGR